MSVDVAPVTSRRDLREFVELPYRLHSTSRHWIPPLRLERRLFLSRRRNAFFTHGEAEYFLARRDGRVAGRITAHIDHAFNAYHGNTWGMFGFLELEDDPEVMVALLDAAAGWLRGQERDRMVGPMDFTMNDESGVLIDGFDRDPMIKQPWHPPHYQRLCESAGLAKAVDLLTWELQIADRAKILPVIFELAEQLQPRHGITVRPMSRRRLRRDLDGFASVYNEAWSQNWGFVPYSERDLDHLAQEMRLVLDPEWTMLAEKDGEVVGAALTFPDINRVLRNMDGRLLPLGWLTFLRERRRIDRVRVGFLGVKPAYQHTGIAARFYVEHFDLARVKPQRWGEMGWILETNDAMNRGMEAMGGRVVKRFRVYQREL